MSDSKKNNVVPFQQKPKEVSTNSTTRLDPNDSEQFDSYPIEDGTVEIDLETFNSFMEYLFHNTGVLTPMGELIEVYGIGLDFVKNKAVLNITYVDPLSTNDNTPEGVN